MSYRIRKTSEELPTDIDPEAEGAGEQPADPREEAGADDFSLMPAVLKAAAVGIQAGFDKDFSSSSGGALTAISDLIFRGIGLMMGTNGDLLQRQIKNESSFEFNEVKVNESSKKALNTYVIRPSNTIYNDNFSRFMSLVKDSKAINTNISLDNTGNEALMIEYKGASTSAWTSSDDSPYKIILKKIIPLLRTKFDAIASFKAKIGAGADIDHAAVGSRFASGNHTDDDVIQVQGLYRAISDWYGLIRTLGGDLGSLRGRRGGPEGSEAEAAGAEGEGLELPSFEDVVSGISIDSVVPKGGVRPGVEPGQIVIDRDGLRSLEEPPIVAILIRGPMARYVQPVGSDMDYFNYFLNNNIIKFPNTDRMRPGDYIQSVSSESVSDGAELTIYFNLSALRGAIGASDDLVKIMEVRTSRDEIEVVAESSDEGLEKASSAATTPQYESTSPNGNRVTFTPADLILGGGYITDSDGKKFKPTKRRGRSLADRVMSPSFGKVRGKKK